MRIKSGRRSTIEHRFLTMTVVVANWGLDNAKSPAAMLQEKQLGRQPQTHHVAGGSACYARSQPAVRTYIPHVG